MDKPWQFRCMRCGHEYFEPYDPKAALVERACPKCRSNSVRPIQAKDAAKPKDAARAKGAAGAKGAAKAQAKE